MTNNAPTVNLVIGLLGGFALGGLYVVYLLAKEKLPVPESLMTLLGTAVGALGAMLAHTSVERGKETPAPVTVVNPTTDPVNTQETK